MPPFANIQDLKEFLSKSSMQEFQNFLNEFSLSNYGDAFFLLRDEIKRSNRKQKLNQLFSYLDSSQNLNKMTASITEKNFLSLLYFLKESPEFQARLSSILIHLPNSVFFHAIKFFEPNIVAFIKNESFLEVLQHHLNQFIKDAQQKLEEFINGAEKLKEKFKENAQFLLNYEQFNHYRNEILLLQEGVTAFILVLEHILGIAWNTLRSDLVERLSNLDKKFKNFSHFVIGKKISENGHSTGLYLDFQKTYGNIYDHSFISDDIPSLEALTALSISNIHDYIHCRLVPFFESSEKYEEHLKQATEKERKEYQNHILLYVQRQLNQLDLATIADLKREGIFSKEIY